nr:PREDICTED: calcitonin gene-related peptide type 1 receptor [Anolis carolinensis]|eukprot:XP_008115776.1 PREDICTED: calcitonin gene-related peptide type 1 receptor [Anolis carolinensis]
MEAKWIIQLLLFFIIDSVQVTAIPEEKEGNSTDEHYLASDKNVTDELHSLGVTMNKIMVAQFECYQKIMQTPVNDNQEPHCNRTWDGWLCWDDVPAGKTAVQNCPDYFQDFDTSGNFSVVYLLAV